MIFNFDGGDILVILLVVIAFILFRRFDRTGRSLEKVRRYADKSKAELDAIVRERELGIKDLAVDLEVQEKTNREILVRAEAAREEILSRAEELESRVEKIEANEKALEDLNELALRVEENLSRLRDESAYVDDVGRRLSDVREKFTSFATKDADRFEDFKEEAISRLAKELDGLRFGIDETGRELSLFRETLGSLNDQQDEVVGEKIALFRDNLESVENDFRARLRKVAEKGAKLEDDAFTELNQKIESRSNRLEANWIGGMNELKDQVASTAEDIQAGLTEARQDIETAAAEFLGIEEGLYRASSDLEGRLDELRNKTAEDIQAGLAESRQDIEKAAAEFRGIEEGLYRASSDLEGRLDELRNKTAEDIQAGLAESRQDIEKAAAEFHGIEENLYRASSNMEDSLDGVRSRIAEDIQAGLAEARQEIKKVAAEFHGIEENLHRASSDMEDSLDGVRSRIAEEIQAGLAEARQEIEKVAAEFHGIEENLHRASSDMEDSLGELRSKTAEEIQAGLAEARQEIEKATAEFHGIEENLHRASSDMEDSLGELRSKTAEEIQAGLAEARQEIEKAAAEFHGIEEGLHRASSDMEGRLGELRSKTAEEIQAGLAEARQEIEKAAAEFRGIEEGLHRTSSELEGSLDELRVKLEGVVERKETTLLEAVEIRQNTYRQSVEERFERIEGFIKDMDTLAESLRLSQDQIVMQVDAAFAAFDADMTERRDLEKVRIEESAASLRQEMTDLEHGLEELKSRAYDNVSEKLQIFEGEFFADLKVRDNQMQAALEEWRKNVEQELADIGQKAGREREETERHYSVELKQKLTDLQTRVFGQFQTFGDQVDGFRESLTGRILAAEEELSAFRDSLNDRISREKDAAFNEFEKSFDSFNKEIGEKLSKANKTVAQKLTELSKDVEINHKEWTGDFKAARDESAEWRERIAAQMNEALRGTSLTIDSMKSDFTVMISELQDEYSGKTEQLLLESGEERTALKRDIGVLEEALNNLSMELTEKSRDSLAALKDQGESFLLEFRKNSWEARDEVERKIKELRLSVQESREQSEANRKEMVAHMDTEYARLMRSLEEIDRCQREFIAETRVFERADEMKSQLESDIAELGRQLEGVGVGQEQIRIINGQYEKAISLYDEVRGKLVRFLSEQQKVENLEGKITRIGSLSESVDLKLSRVTEANDNLSDLQVRLKQLEDLHEDLVGRYERLSEKSKVLDVTTDSVDRNFERMARIEEILKDVAERIVPLRDNLSAAEERQVKLDSDGEKIDVVMGKVSSIDSTIVELDSRLDDLGKAREWLARTETRLEEINIETQQKVRLLGTLSKREGSRQSAGSPDMSTREVVVKLAREGWNSEEIARTTKLSRGEVELILELTPNE